MTAAEKLRTRHNGQPRLRPAPQPRPSRAAKLLLTPDLAGILMTPADFDAAEIADKGHRYELINSRLIVMPPPSIEHRDPNGELEYLLRRYRYEHPKGAAMDGTVAEHYLRPGDNRRIADRVIWVGLGRLPDPINDVPAIVVEFVSEGRRNQRRDYEEKKNEYMTSGVREYWIIDRFARTLTVWRKGSKGAARRTVKTSAVYRTPLLPGFELPLARLQESADQWAAENK